MKKKKDAKKAAPKKKASLKVKSEEARKAPIAIGDAE
jgi:hypothetical protein